MLLVGTLLLTALYLTGAAGIARRDVLYGTLVAAAWAVFYSWQKVLDSASGRLLAAAGRRLGPVAGVLFLGFVYWTILGR
jgi:hypothetical protein